MRPIRRGQCVSTAADTYPDCHASAVNIPVTATSTVVTVMFSQLTGGVPVAAVTGKDVVGLEWAFDWTPGATTGTAGAGAGGAASAGAGGTGAGGARGGAGGATSAGGAAAGPYDADITIDDVTFIGGPPAGGAGGASGSGAGGASASGGAGGAKGGAAGTGG